MPSHRLRCLLEWFGVDTVGWGQYGSLMVLAVGLAGCGIPSYPSLIAPETLLPTSPESGLELAFNIPTLNDADIFEGFELYYKIYSGGDEASGLIATDIESIVDLATLQQASFDPMILAEATDDLIRPLVPIQDSLKSDGDIVIVLDFAPIIAAEPAEFPSLSIDEDATSLARNIALLGNPPVPAGFSDDSFDATDTDMPVTFDPESADPLASILYISMYVLSYGNDIPALQFNIYSQPSFAGYILVPGR